VLGGAALVLTGLKGYTLNLDLAFREEEGARAFVGAAEGMGYVPIRHQHFLRLYGRRPTIDIYLGVVYEYRLSDGMAGRAERMDLGRIALFVLHPQDILLLKTLSGRPKDVDDIKLILGRGVDWGTLLDEVRTQLSLGASSRIVLNLGYHLERLAEEGFEVPRDVLDRLWEMLE